MIFRSAAIPKKCFAWIAASCLLGAVACDQPKTGPRRADHAAAHSERYHPDTHSRTPARREVEPSASSQPTPTSGPGPVGSPVLFVNGDTVTVPEILEPILAELEKDAKQLPPQLYYSNLRRTIRRQIDLHVSTLLIYQEAANHYPEKAVEAFDKEADRRIKEIVTDRFQGVYARYEAYLKALELTRDDVKNRIKRQVMVTQYMRDKYKPLLREPPRRELFEYYQHHLDEFTTPERAELNLIEIPVDSMLGKPRETATKAEIDAARARAVARMRRAREELDSGVEFPAVARAYSKGVKAAQGGAWGEISPGTLQGRWAKAAEVLFTLPENGTSDVIETEEAVFLVRCGKRTPRQQISFEDAQPKIIERVKDEQFNKLSQEHIDSLVKKATVRPVAEFVEAVVAAAPRPAPPPLTTSDPAEQAEK
ncbi:MAG TPA: peptidylprolyl isomerase [Phycisphaerae bacterium]|nr:peptidylprolyl isomerase [Phycisphaerae bacterium]HOM51969.1 peptidylprolyl isomerase [Phycisphaerae bacterium]HOQ85658.1 peptidylprolyl isomerase [Phycisphaerae bacterium]HPP27407.1 peptidylprolyl isomerase [Phycisphaerae bacterium]